MAVCSAEMAETNDICAAFALHRVRVVRVAGTGQSAESAGKVSAGRALTGADTPGLNAEVPRMVANETPGTLDVHEQG